jgi:hypothetical protein
MSDDYKARLLRILQQYEPGQLGQADKMLEKYKGKEEAMIKALVKKYGPEPPGGGAVASEAKKPPELAAAASPVVTIPAVSQGSPAATVDWNARLQKYCAKRCPENTGKINALLAKYKGKEDAMIQDLVKKYGPEEDVVSAQSAESPVSSPSGSPRSVAPSTSTRTDSDDYKARLLRILQQYEPGQLGQADKMLEKYKGKEEAMIKALVKKYGPEPPGGGAVAAPPAPAGPAGFTIEQRIRRLVKKYQNDKYEQVPAMLEKYKGKEEQLIASLVKKFGAEPTEPMDIDGNTPAAASPAEPKMPYNSPFPPRERLVRFYTKYRQVDKLSGDTIDKALTKYKDDEEFMFQTLVKKYGAEPLPDEVLPALTVASGAVPDPTNPYEHRLIRFYTKYQPDKLNNVQKALETYKGREEAMFETLVKKYGPEPLPDESGGATAAATASPVNPYEHRLIRFYTKYQPDKLNNVQKALETFKGREEAMFETLVQKYGPEPPEEVAVAEANGPASPPQSPGLESPSLVVAGASAPFSPTSGGLPPSDGSLPSEMPVGTDFRNRLIRFYMRHQPSKTLSDVDKALSQFNGREETMFEILVKKYGPEPAVEAAAVVAATSDRNRSCPEDRADGIVGRFDRERQQLISLFEKFAPDRVFQVDALLAAFASRNLVGDLVRAAHAEYGAPYIPIEAKRGPGSNLFGKYPTTASDSTIGIIGAGKLTISIGEARSIPYSDAAQALSTLEAKEPKYEAVVAFAGKDLFRAPGKESAKVRGVVAFQEGTDNTFLLLLDGTEFLVTVRLYRDHRFLGEARMTLAALPHVGSFEFQLVPRQSEMDPYILERKGDLGTLSIAWSFVNSEFLVSYRNVRRELMGDGAVPPSAALGAAEKKTYAEDPWHQRLAAMFCRFLPEKLADIPFILAEHRGRENELLDSLSLKFGAEPDPRDFQATVERIFYVNDPQRVRESKLFAVQSIGREQTVLRSLVKKYGEVPPVLYVVPPLATRATHSLVDTHRVRLTRWIMLRCPRRVSEIDYFLVRFLGREQKMFSMLREVLGPEPSDAPPRETLRSACLSSPALRHYFASRRAPPFLKWMWMDQTDRQTAHEAASDRASTSAGNAAPKESQFTSRYVRFRNRLERFYKHYNPVKLSEVEDTLQRWQGKEDLLFEALVHKYGGEPAVEAPSRDLPATSSPGQPPHRRHLSPQMTSSSNPAEDRSRLRGELQRHYSATNPNKLRSVEETLNRFAGKEAILESIVSAKYARREGDEFSGSRPTYSPPKVLSPF